MKKNKRILKKIWVCNDILMDILPLFDRPQLGLKLALISPRFNALVDKHFDGKSQLTIWRPINIQNAIGLGEPKLSVFTGKFNQFPPAKDYRHLHFPLPDRPLHNKIRFNNLRIEYIDHSVIDFLRSNRQIFDRGTNMDLLLYLDDKHDNNGIVQPIWEVFACEIWPIFAPNIRHLTLPNSFYLDKLRRHISPTILTDLNQLDSIHPDNLVIEEIGDDGQNSTAGQALSKWLNTPRKDGKPKQLSCTYTKGINEWVNDFKEEFLRATISSTNYIIQFITYTSITQFELVNEQTKEKLTLKAEEEEESPDINCVLKRCQIGVTIQWEDKKTDNLNNVNIWLSGNCIGPLSPPESDQMNAKSGLKMSAGPSGQRKKN